VSSAWTIGGTRNGHEPPPPGWTPAPPPAEPDEVIAGNLVVDPEPYDTRPVRPVTQLAIRVALWGAVALGCLGGLTALVSPRGGAATPPAPPSAADTVLPTTVAGEAEVVTRAWLTATPDQQDALNALFVNPPDLSSAGGKLTVGNVTAVAGRVLQKDYWSVTVAAEVGETVTVVDQNTADPAAGENGDPAAEPAHPRRRQLTWYVEVPIVGDAEGGLAALSTPAVLPGLPKVSTGWRPSINALDAAGSDDPTAKTVTEFLTALLTGDGDPERFVAPGVEVTAADPPLFASIDVADLATDQLDDGRYRVLATAWATTPGGARRLVSYELIVVKRVDRLEITQFSGAPTMVAGSATPATTTTTAPGGPGAN
jgi:hypothetical protein